VPAQEDLVARNRQIKGLASCATPQTTQKNSAVYACCTRKCYAARALKKMGIWRKVFHFSNRCGLDAPKEEKPSRP
jgi:hypothetical protein